MNGQFVPEKDARISIFDSALMFGDMVFEMTRSFKKKQFKLREHLERLYAGIKILRIPLKMSLEEMEALCHEVARRNDQVFSPTDEHRLMINVSRGPLGIYAQVFDGKLEPTVVIADFPLKWTVVGMGKLFDTGINAVIPSQRAIPASLLDPKIKNRSRLHYQMANIEVSQVQGDNNWALLLDPDGFIAEGTGDNFFIVKDLKLITPEGRNILRGITRETIFELAPKLGLTCVEKNIEPYDVYMADEAFMTGTPFCILPVTSLHGVMIKEGKMGTVTRRLLERWGQDVDVDIIQQIRSFNREIEDSSGSATPYKFRK
jgi:branched-chain amino acid aminotransferase